MAQVPNVDVDFDGDGVTAIFDFDFPYQKQSEIFVSVDGVNVAYTWLAGNTHSVQVLPAPALGTKVRVYRSTLALVPLHVFAAGVPFLPRYVDENAKQLLYALQEGVSEFRDVADTAEAALAGVTDAQEAAEEAAASAAAVASSVNRALRVAPTESPVPVIPDVATRRNRLLGFDSAGDPVVLPAGTDSAAQLALDLKDPTKGAHLVQYTADVTVNDALVKIESKLAKLVAITDFAGAVEGAANSAAAAFAAAEASVYTRIYMPLGVWNAGSTVLTKQYYGLGKLVTGGAYRGQEYSNITTDPLKAANPDFEFAATGDISHVNVARTNLGRIRLGLDEYYFNASTTPVWRDMVSQAGHSGTSGKFQEQLLVGGDIVKLSGPCPELTVGKDVSISNGTLSFRAKITENGGGQFIRFAPASPYNFNTVYTEGTVPTYGYITCAIRTMNTLHMSNVEHQGGGDSYIWCGRIIASNKYKQASQDNYHETATVGIIGGDLLSVTPGGFMTATEVNLQDSNYQGSFQSSGMGHLVNLQRTADNGLYGCTWMGFYTKSEGTQHADVAYRASGRFKRGLDLGGMLFDADRAAITIPRLGRIYLDAKGLNTDTRGTNWWSDTPGGAWIGTGGGGDVILAQGGQGRIAIETDNTRIRARIAGGHVILDQGYLDLYTEVTATAGASQGYATIFINGVARKVQVFATP